MVTYFGLNEVELRELRDKWYSDKRVQFLVVWYLRGRETSFLSPSGLFTNVRHCKVHSVDFLLKNWSAFDFRNKDFNLYYSVACFEGHPVFSFNSEKRHLESRDFRSRIADFIVGYDLVFDFDAHGRFFKDFRKGVAWRECKVLCEDLKLWNVNFRVKFSGNGFHVTIPYEQFKNIAGSLKVVDFMDRTGVYGWCKLVRERIVSLLGLGSVDLRIVNVDRLWKTEWSFVLPYGTVAIPLSWDEFLNFDIGLVDARKLLLRPDLYGRGVEWTHEGVPDGFETYVRSRLKKY